MLTHTEGHAAQLSHAESSGSFPGLPYPGNVSNQFHAHRDGLLFQGLGLSEQHAVLPKGQGAALTRGSEKMLSHAYTWGLSGRVQPGGLRWRGGRVGLLPAGVVEGFEGSEIPPRGGKAILQKLPAALAWGLEQLYVTSQPGHEGSDHDVWHLGQLVV